MSLDKAAEAAYRELIRQLPNATDLSDVHHNKLRDEAYTMVLPYDAFDLRAVAEAARLEALEEAAKIAEDHEDDMGHGKGSKIAAAIRERAK